MIFSIRGIVVLKEQGYLVVETCGVGYQIFVLDSLSLKKGTEVFLYTHLYIRQEIYALYGFLKAEERELFSLLLGVAGIGPKVALTILNSLPLQELIFSITSGKVKILSQIPGIGLKTAQRLVLDLKDKLQRLHCCYKEVLEKENDLHSEVVLALRNLGFLPKEAIEMANLSKEEGLTLNEWVKRALRLKGKVL